MNALEKKFLYLALFLFALGGVSHLGFLSEMSPLQESELIIGEESQNAEEKGIEETFAEKPPVTDIFKSPISNEVSLTETPFSSTAKPTKSAKKSPAFPLKINSASKEDLCFIKGVGPSLAQKIIDHRSKKGNFRTGKDLEKVSGIGTKKRKAIEEFIVFD